MSVPKFAVFRFHRLFDEIFQSSDLDQREIPISSVRTSYPDFDLRLLGMFPKGQTRRYSWEKDSSDEILVINKIGT